MPTTDPVSLLDRTILKGVGRVVPGTILEIAQKGVSGCRFWNPDDVRRFGGGRLMKRSVCLRRQFLAQLRTDCRAMT